MPRLATNSGSKLLRGMTQNLLPEGNTSARQARLVPRLMGGLGNQLFIYSAALQFAHRLNAFLMLDIASGFDRDFTYRREYLLDQFAITDPCAAPSECFLGLRGRLLRGVMLKADRAGLAGNRWTFIDESSLIVRVGAQKFYLDGYWQSENNFLNVDELVRQKFRSRESLPAATKDELSQIRGQMEPVAVCIRRGADRAYQGQGLDTDLDFYQAALRQLALLHPRSHVFVFTDNPEWAKEHFRCALPHTFVSHKLGNRRAYEDLALMSACRHFVIGNSTFHWWGAWLGERVGSQIIVPKRFAEAYPNFYPKRWQRI